MSDEPTCCYCGATEGIFADAYGVWGCIDRNACLLRCQVLDARAESAALALAHDASVAAYERREHIREDLGGELLRVAREWHARAESAEAQLAATREALTAANRLVEDERTALARCIENNGWVQEQWRLCREQLARVTAEGDDAAMTLARKVAALEGELTVERGQHQFTRLAYEEACASERHWGDRAAALQAQLATARADGARSMADYLDGFLGPIGAADRLAEWQAGQETR